MPSYSPVTGRIPNVILQAGAMGLPCIVTNINGCNEIIENGKNGIIIPPHDSEYLYRTMCGFLSSPRLVEHLASAARPQIVQKYDRRTLWEAFTKGLSRTDFKSNKIKTDNMYLYGAGGHAKVIMDILKENSTELTGIIDDNPHIQEWMEYHVLPTIQNECSRYLSVSETTASEKYSGTIV